MRRTWITGLGVVIVVAGVFSATLPGRAQKGTQKGEWRTYGGDLGSTRYAPLDQINAANFNTLQVAWRLGSQSFGPEYNWQTTPLVVNGTLFTTIGNRRSVAAVNAATGELQWMYRYVDEGERAKESPRQGSGKGLAYWTDGAGDERILFITVGYQLVALDAKTGLPVAGFGTKGIVDLKQGLEQPVDLVTGEIAQRSALVVAKNVAIIGAAHDSQPPKTPENVKGYMRGYDVRTGKRLWIFHTVPQPGEFGNDTWLKDSWSYTGNTGAWAQMSVDEELGIAYLPIETPTNDYYGGHRPGNGLFGESLLALDLMTGKRKWHFQLVHHGIWDYDPPTAPILADVTINGRPRKIVAQPTKQGFLYVFDRVTGEPIWPIEERPVPKGDVPGEWYSPTQPFPTKPPAFDRQGFTLDDVIDFTPELKAEGEKLAAQYKLGPVFTPPIVAGGALRGTILMPAPDGGINWAGGSYDPETGIAYIASHTHARAIGLAKDPNRPTVDFALAPGRAGGGEGGGPPITVDGIPLVRPPWARITAIDLNKGDIVWQVPHGETPDHVRNHPALKGLNIPRTGAGTRHMTMVTKTLVIAGERIFYQTPKGRGARLRAYDKATGANVGEVFIPAPVTGGPMSYQVAGKQYLVVAVGGGTVPGELIAFALP
jgi:quinoprotein glucose dehydrogenase